MAEFKSKRAVVSKPPYQLYMAFVDMRNFVQFLPEDKKESVTADYDSIRAEALRRSRNDSTPCPAMIKSGKRL